MPYVGVCLDPFDVTKIYRIFDWGNIPSDLGHHVCKECVVMKVRVYMEEDASSGSWAKLST